MTPFSEMLKPSLKKINIAVFLFIIFGYLAWPLLTSLFGSEDILLGFPMPIRRIALSADGVSLDEPFNALNVAIDFCFWYLIGIVYLWYRQEESSLSNE